MGAASSPHCSHTSVGSHRTGPAAMRILFMVLVMGSMMWWSQQHRSSSLWVHGWTSSIRWGPPSLFQHQQRQQNRCNSDVVVVDALGATSSSSSSSFSTPSSSTPLPTTAVVVGLRLNRVFGVTHSRRQADALIASGRVSVNNDHDPPSIMGRKVVHGDIVRLDGSVVEWEHLLISSDEDYLPNKASTGVISLSSSSTALPSHHHHHEHEYIKYWKPKGVTCTCDRRVPNNILDALEQSMQQQSSSSSSSSITTSKQQHQGRSGKESRDKTKHHHDNSIDEDSCSKILLHRRIFPVGRLDKDSTGLILLTSDGQIPNAVLHQKQQLPKTYHVTIDRPILPQDLQQLGQGVVITNEYARVVSSSSSSSQLNPDRRNKAVVRKSFQAKTLPAQVRLLPSSNGRRNHHHLEMTIVEGRNRQIRKMLSALQYTVLELHRVSFLNITLEGLQQPGDWCRLTHEEWVLLQQQTTH